MQTIANIYNSNNYGYQTRDIDMLLASQNSNLC